MNPNKKSTPVRGVPQPFNRQDTRHPIAPPVYNPQATPKAVQTKMVNGAVNRNPPSAPAVYRPQAVPKVLQTKKAALPQTRVQTGSALPRLPIALVQLSKKSKSREGFADKLAQHSARVCITNWNTVNAAGGQSNCVPQGPAADYEVSGCYDFVVHGENWHVNWKHGFSVAHVTREKSKGQEKVNYWFYVDEQNRIKDVPDRLLDKKGSLVLSQSDHAQDLKNFLTALYRGS